MCMGSRHKASQDRPSKQQTSLSPGPGGWGSEIQGRAGLVPPEAALLGESPLPLSSPSVLSLCPYMVVPLHVCVLTASSSKDKQIGSGPALVAPVT